MDRKALYRIGYGLYVLTAREGEKDNGCIINTLVQVTGEPCWVSIAVNKANYTCGMIERTGLFNVSMLTEKADFRLFQRFGFQSGKDADKFAGLPCPRLENGLLAVEETANAVLSGKVFSTVDLGTHLLFLADVTDARVLSGDESVTYSYYQRHIKPAPAPRPAAAAGKTVWRCPVCGHVYEGEELPADYVCPICKHAGSEFVKETVAAAPAASGKTVWRCPICGHIYEGEELPADYVCPICKHPAAEFEKVTL